MSNFLGMAGGSKISILTQSKAALLLAAAAVALAGCGNKPGKVYLSPDPPSTRAVGLRVMSFNIARGAGMSAFAPGAQKPVFAHNLGQISRLFQREQPHIVGLQEVDTTSEWTGGFDTMLFMGRQSGYHHGYLGLHTVINWFGLTNPKMIGGSALLARVPLRSPTSLAFKLDPIDSAGFVAATIAVPEFGGREVDVLSVHLNPESASKRLRQTVILAEYILAQDRPVVVVGDMNNATDDPDPIDLLADWVGLKSYRPEDGAPTYPSAEPRKRLDWILISEPLEFADYHTLPERLSDHQPVLATILWPGAERGAMANAAVVRR